MFYLVIAILLAGIGYFGYNEYVDSQNKKIIDSIVEHEKVIFDNLEKELEEQDLEAMSQNSRVLYEVYLENPNTEAGRRAGYMHSLAEARTGNVEVARDVLLKIVTAEKSDLMLENAHYLLLVVLTDLDESDSVIEHAKTFEQKFPSSFLLEEALLLKARAHVASGDRKSAYDIYQKMLVSEPLEIYRNKVNMELAYLEMTEQETEGQSLFDPKEETIEIAPNE